MNIKKYLKILGLTTIFVCVIFIFIFFYLIYPLKHVSIIKQCANKYGLEPALLASIIRTESSFKKNVVSPKGAVGLMQLMPNTAEWLCDKTGEEYEYDKLFEEEYNINLGSYYLSYLIDKFESVDTAIVAYNAGEGNVVLWLKNASYSHNKKTLYNIPYKESKMYLKRVKTALSVYRARVF